ncbi:MAG: DegT/DnrJ/EryC1/StrS family aminotransferase [Anaerolineae bacterium]|nr:DegT/DnrJ/EryC1/StrS family aminotransferase [Anaerolineae bacterium]
MIILEKVSRKPALLGAEPLFTEPLGIVRPLFPTLVSIAPQVSEMLRTGQLTNLSKNVPALEKELSRYMDVPHCVAVANGTLGLILALAGLKLSGEVIIPSFTFSATAHAVRWAGLEPVFADINPETFTLDPQAVEAAVTPRTAAILGVHVYGHPCDIAGLQAVAERYELALLFDAAHAFGSGYRGRKIGAFGDAEIFSFHATKIFPTGEGGGVTTTHPHLAEYVALARKFGDPGTEDTLFCGMNAKMQEFNAVLGLENLKQIDRWIENRCRYADLLVERLSRIPGLRFQQIQPDVQTNYQNFAVLVDEAEFGLNRDEVHAALAAENIFTRKYFYPPLHQHQAYAPERAKYQGRLPVTEMVANRVLCLPFYSEMNQEMLEGICRAMESIHCYAGQLTSSQIVTRS